MAAIIKRQSARRKIEHLHGNLCLTAVEGQEASNDCEQLIAEVERLHSALRAATAPQDGQELLRPALVGLVGVDGREDLEQLEGAMRLLPAPAQDKAVTIDAIHALIATLPAAPQVAQEENPQ